MIFVTLGTQDKSFHRLLEKIEKQIETGMIQDKVIVQAGNTKFQSKHMEILDFIPMDTFQQYIKDADYVITHGGVGSIVDALKENKKVIAVPRKKEYKEHTNDHQEQIIHEFASDKYIIGINSVDELDAAIKKVEKFKPKKYQSNNKKFIKVISDYIEQENHIGWYNKYREVISYLVFGGLTTVINIVAFYIMDLMGINTYVNNTIAWIASVIFAYVTNKLFVFESKTTTRKELVREVSSFFAARIFSYVVDMVGMYLFVSVMMTNKIFAKIVMNVVVIVINYVFSKLFIFQSNGKKEISK
ncbi:MAG: GtrA family protein [Firmicutes bacterium]|nr:GtrA family protein [Bacillota bacterium]